MLTYAILPVKLVKVLISPPTGYCEMTHPVRGEPPTRPRTSLQAALQITIDDCVENAREFAEAAGIPASTLSEFRNNRRGVHLSTLQLILNALNRDQYTYFVKIFIQGNMLLDQQQDLLGSFTSGTGSDDMDTLKRAFHALVASYCAQCSRMEQLELLTVIHQSSTQNSKLIAED